MKQFEQDTVMHLYENAHSGFYGPDNSATVDLLPKTWTRYTVTDGDWMQKETIEPLVNRDIYLANKIDELDNYFGNLYSAGRHISIDKTTNTISLLPYEYDYVFTDGIICDEYAVTTDLPEMYGGLTNKLKLGDNGITYKYTSGTTATGSAMSGEGIIVSAGLIGDKYFPMDKNIVLVTSAIYKMDKDYSDSGNWIEGYTDLYDREQGKKVYKEYNGERPEPITINEHISGENVFNPSDFTIFNQEELTGGKNYNTKTGETFNPTGVLYIYD